MQCSRLQQLTVCVIACVLLLYASFPHVSDVILARPLSLNADNSSSSISSNNNVNNNSTSDKRSNSSFTTYSTNKININSVLSTYHQPEKIKITTTNLPIRRKTTKILIWVMTCKGNLASKASVVKKTWGARADTTIYVSSENNATFPAIGLPGVQDGRGHLTAKTMQAFQYVYDNHFNDADWFMKADDDTYVLVENLRRFLARQNASQPVYYGRLLKSHGGYHSGGAGYVLSKEALRRFGTRNNTAVKCRKDGGDEDVEMGVCMRRLGVKPINAKDEHGWPIFHQLALDHHLLGKWYHYKVWMWNYDASGAPWGLARMSARAATFHYTKPQEMEIFDYLLYKLRPDLSFAKTKN